MRRLVHYLAPIVILAPWMIVTAREHRTVSHPPALRFIHPFPLVDRDLLRIVGPICPMPVHPLSPPKDAGVTFYMRLRTRMPITMPRCTNPLYRPTDSVVWMPAVPDATPSPRERPRVR